MLNVCVRWNESKKCLPIEEKSYLVVKFFSQEDFMYNKKAPEFSDFSLRSFIEIAYFLKGKWMVRGVVTHWMELPSLPLSVAE